MTRVARGCLLVYLLGSCAAGQVATGTPPFGSFAGGPEVLDLANLNAQITIPVVHIPGRGQGFDYDLTYDSSVWYPVTSSGKQSWQPVVNWGWRGQTEAATGYVTYTQSGSSPACYVGQTATGVQYTQSNWTYHDSFGAAHPFAGSTIHYQGSTYCPPDTSLNVTTGDGSGWTVSARGLSLYSMTSRSGTVTLPPLNTTGGLASATDRNGNQISVNGSGQFFGTLSSTVAALTVTGGAPNPLKLTYTVSAGGTATATVTVNYTAYTVATNFGVAGISEYGKQNVSLASSVVLPDGSAYTLSYEPTPAIPSSGACSPLSGTYSNNCVTARISSVQLPTGGTIAYTYTGGSNGIFKDGTAATLTRQTPDGTWQYARTLGTGSASTLIVTDPSSQANQTVIQFQGLYETQRQVYSGSSTSGTLLETVNTCYNGFTSPCTGIAVSLPITQRSVSGSLDLSGLQSYSISFFNGYGASTELDEYGYGSGGAGALLRKTKTTYASLGNIAGFPSQVQTSDASGNVISQTNYFYDETTPTTTSGIAQHGTISGSRGNLTHVRYCTVLPSCSSYLSTGSNFDDTGQVLSSWDSVNNTTSFSYTDSFFTDNGANPPATYSPSAPTNAYLTKVTTPIIGTAANYGYYFNSGNVAVAKDQNGADGYSHFDLVDRLSTQYLPAFQNGNRPWFLAQYPSSTETDSYTSIGSTSASSACTSCRHQQENLDGLGRSASDVLVNDPDGETTSITSYDPRGHVLTTTNPYRSTSDPTYGTTARSYDPLNRVTTVTHADGSASRWFYGQAVASNGGASAQLCSSGTYGVGYPTLVVDPSGKKRQTWADGLGRGIEVDEPDSNGNLTVGTCSAYNLLNALTQVVQGTLTRTYTYDVLGRPSAISTPEAGTTNIYYTTSGGALCSGVPSYACRRTDARGITATYTYDALNRMTSITYSDGTRTVQYFYDQTSYDGLTITNGKGRMTGMSDAAGSSAWSYDKLGEILTQTHTISAVTKNISYGYNLDGSIANVTYPSGRLVNYSVGNAQRPQTVVDSNGTNYVTSATYAPQGALGSMIFGKSTSFAGITQSYGYNNRLHLTSQVASSSAGAILNLGPSFPSSPSNNGQVTSIVNNLNTGETQSFSYDPLHRIASAQSSATSGTACWGQSFGYDTWGNLLSINVTKCSAGSLSVAVNNNRMVGFSYDSAGDLTNDGTYTYTYDGAGHMTSAAGVTYTYDGWDLRVKKSNGTLYWRDYFGNALSETDLSGNIINEYVFFEGMRSALITSSGSVYYYFPDRLGTTRAIAASTGSVCYSADFTPFGQEIAYTNTCPQNYKFTGYERDSETGTDYAIYRQYSQYIGRFLQPDPLAGGLNNPQSLNRYSYVLNDPLNWTDHIGMSPCPAGTTPANAAQAKAIVAAAQSSVGKGTYSQMDCSHLVNQVANAVAGYQIPYSTSGAFNGGNPVGFTPDASGPQVGDVVAFKSPGHVAIVTSASPFAFIGSQGQPGQSGGGPALVAPGVVGGHNDYNYWTGTARKSSATPYWKICIKNKTTANNGAGMGNPTYITAGWDEFDLMAMLFPPARTETVTARCIGCDYVQGDSPDPAPLPIDPCANGCVASNTGPDDGLSGGDDGGGQGGGDGDNSDESDGRLTLPQSDGPLWPIALYGLLAVPGVLVIRNKRRVENRGNRKR